jgi:hypothetical protein
MHSGNKVNQLLTKGECSGERLTYEKKLEEKRQIHNIQLTIVIRLTVVSMG